MPQNIILLILFIAGFFFPSTGISKEVKMNPVRFETKENGMVVQLLTRSSLPIVNVKVLVQAGAIYEPAEKNGLASLVAELLNEGTKTRSSQEISDEIDFIGGSLHASGGTDYVSLSIRVLKKDIEKGFDLLSDIMINPAFKEDEIERTRDEIISAIISEKDEPGLVAKKEFNRLLFGDHPYSRPLKGKEETLRAITRDDILNFYNSFYAPNNTIIAIVGDVDEKETRNLIKKYFGGWAKKKLDLPVIAQPKKIAHKVSVIDRQLTQANIMLGHIGISRSNPDFYPLIVTNFILGSGSTSRLYKNIREESGLAYSIYSYFDSLKHTGKFVVGLQTKNSSAKEAVEKALSEIRTIMREKVSNEELNDAKSYITGSFPLRIDTNSETASLLAFIEFYELGSDYFNTYRKKIEAVTLDEMLKVSKKYFDPVNYLLVVVANKEEAGY